MEWKDVATTNYIESGREDWVLTLLDHGKLKIHETGWTHSATCDWGRESKSSDINSHFEGNWEMVGDELVLSEHHSPLGDRYRMTKSILVRVIKGKDPDYNGDLIR